MALLGNNYLSFLLSVELLEWDKKVILIDDKRVSYGQHFTDYLCQLEYDFLMVWGEDRHIESLQKLQHYVVNKPFVLMVGDQRVLLGNTPSQNLSELIRKFPQFFADEDGLAELDNFLIDEEQRLKFDQQYFSFCSRLAENSFRFRTSQNLSLSHFLSLCPDSIKSTFQQFEKRYSHYHGQHEDFDQKTFDTVRSFYYLIRGLFHRKLSIDASEFELFHLFISLLSPHYELDQSALLRDLLPTFTDRGGVYKKTQVKEWLFDKMKPWSLELSSYEGIIHPQKIAILGGRPEGLPIKVDVKDKSFRSINIDISFEGDIQLKLGVEGQRVFYTRSDKVGSLYPFWEGRFFENSGSIKFYTRSYKGMKVNFVKDFLLSEIEKDLLKISKGPIQNIRITNIEFGTDLCLEEITISGKKFKQDSPLLSKTHVFDATEPGKYNKLKNVLYYGPLKRASFGLFSTMMEIKDSPSLY